RSRRRECRRVSCHDRVHLCAAAEGRRHRGGLEGRLVHGSVGLLEGDEGGHARTPISRRTSTTLGAAAAPSPSTSACFPSPSGTTRRAIASLGAGRSGVLVSTGLRCARRRPGTEGYRGRLRPSLTVTTA